MKYGILVLLTAAGTLTAQDADRVTVPFSNPSGAKTVRIDAMQGDITVRTHTANEVIVDMRGKSRRPRRSPREAEGLKRIDIGGAGVAIEERENVVSISSPAHSGGDDLTVLVPANVTLRVKSMNGDVTVDGVSGELDLNSHNGEVRATNVEGSLIAHSLNGEVTVVLNRYDGKPMSFSTLNGDIDVTLPPETKARLKMKADHGEVYSDFEMNLEPTTQKVEQSDARAGRYKVKIERVAYATINGGGPEIAFTTLNGEIRIRQKK